MFDHLDGVVLGGAAMAQWMLDPVGGAPWVFTLAINGKFLKGTGRRLWISKYGVTPPPVYEHTRPIAINTADLMPDVTPPRFYVMGPETNTSARWHLLHALAEVGTHPESGPIAIGKPRPKQLWTIDPL